MTDLIARLRAPMENYDPTAEHSLETGAPSAHAELVLWAASEYLAGVNPLRGEYRDHIAQMIPRGAVLECWLVTETADLQHHERHAALALAANAAVHAKWMDSDVTR